MAADEEISMLLLILYRRRKRRKSNKHRKRFSVRKLFQHQKTRGEFHNLVRELQLHDHELFSSRLEWIPGKWKGFLVG